MIIRKITLYNFGVYAGTNEFEFHGKKPIVLVGGLNGRGKTTFLEAVLLALYGRNSFMYNETKNMTYGQYLKAHVNGTDGTLESYIDLEFIMSESENEIYRIHREWSGAGRRTAETIRVFRDGIENSFLTDNWLMFMENVLPSGLSNFFFFDGEKIAELAVENTSVQMKESIKSLLGITVLDHLENDLNRIISRTLKSKIEDSEVLEIAELRMRKEKAEADLVEIDSLIEERKLELQNILRNIDKENERYIAHGGDIVAQRQDLIEKRNIVRVKLENCKEDLLIDASSELPLALVRNYLTNIREKSEMEHERKIFSAAILKMYATLDKYNAQSNCDMSQIRSFIQYFENRIVKKEDETIFDLSDMALSQCQMLLDQKLINKKIEVKEKKERRAALQKEADQLESYLSVDIDEKAVNKIYKRIKMLELTRVELEAMLTNLQEKRHSYSGSLSIISTEFNKKVEAYLKKVEINDDSDRVIKYAHLAISVLEKYKIRLQESKVETVADTMTSCYKKLANKKNLIEKIKMDPITLDLIYINKAGEEVSKTSLSAGEKQLMVISLLWALALCSKKKLPVIIDTPLSRLDSVHREALIKVYFPQASDQTIILSTDSEIDEKYYEMMKPNIDDEFTLVYDDESKSTSIRKGYFN